MSPETPPVRWRPGTPDGWLEQVERSFTLQGDSYGGSCPRCEDYMSKDLSTVKIPLGLRRDQEGTIEVYLVCNCGLEHEARPDDAIPGCGADGYLRMRV